MNSHACGVYISKTLQIFYAFELVFHLLYAKVAECCLLKVASAVARTSVVEDEEQIALLSHICFPAAARIVPACLHVTYAGASVDVYNGRIFLVRIKAYRLHHSVIQVCGAVGSLDGSTRILRYIVAFPWVGSCKIVDVFSVACAYNVYLARHIWFAVVVIKIFSGA